MEPFQTPQAPLKSNGDANTWALILHLSQFATYLIPFAGIIAPLVIWQIKKDQMPIIDAHGKIVANWMISVFIYTIISIILMFVVVGIFMLWILGFLVLIFPIIGAVKAASGEVWRYPLSINFF
ncbi:MAG: DUF4870 domain-containing protein [Planctomycetota bacterium]